MLVLTVAISCLILSLVSQLVKNPPAMHETWVRSLGWEDLLEKGKATDSSILAWSIPWTVWSMGWQRVRQDWTTFTHPLTQFTLIHGPNIPGSYAILFFTKLDFTFITSHIPNWALFFLWLSLFILSGAVSPLFSSSILGTYRPGKFIFQCCIFFSFQTVQVVPKAKYWRVCHSLLQRTTFVRTPHHDQSVLGGPTQHGS